jgi:membrane protein involved in colicin uptake
MRIFRKHVTVPSVNAVADKTAKDKLAAEKAVADKLAEEERLAAEKKALADKAAKDIYGASAAGDLEAVKKLLPTASPEDLAYTGEVLLLL